MARSFFQQPRLPHEGYADACGNNAYFAPSGATIVRFATELRVPRSFRRGRGLSCASQAGLPRARLAGEEKKK